MARLIDADALQKAMFSYYSCVNEHSTKWNYCGDTLMDYEVADLIEDCIDNAPTVDPESLRPHGKWRRSGMLIECCFCGEIYSLLGGNDDKSWNACPSCTAIMDLEEEMTNDQD